MTEVEIAERTPVRTRHSSQFRIRMVVLLTLIAVSLFWFALESLSFWPRTVARVAFPWADNQWSDGPILLQLHRLELGQPAYLSPLEANSFDYGPIYLFALFFLRRISGAPFTIISFRVISIGLGLLATIPFAACALLIARTLGLERVRSLPALLVVAASALLTVAVLTRDIAFDSLHPDTLTALLVGTLLAIYYAIASRRLRGRFVWALVVVNLFAVFTKQNSVLVLPILLVGLALVRSISWRQAGWAMAAFSFGVVVVLSVIPADMRAWTFLIPASHPYEFTKPRREAEFVAFLAYWQYYIVAELAAVAIVVFLIARRGGRTAYGTHGAVLLAVVAMSTTAYFKVLGVWNNLTLIALFCAPYCATLLGLLSTPRFVKKTSGWLTAAAVVLLFVVGNGLHAATARWTPTPEMIAQMKRLETAMHRLCATGKPILATTFADMFMDCPNARVMPATAYEEETAARRGFDPGLYAFDRPVGFAYLVDLSTFPIPRRWQRTHRIEREYPAVFGFGNYYYAPKLRVWVIRTALAFSPNRRLGR